MFSKSANTILFLQLFFGGWIAGGFSSWERQPFILIFFIFSLLQDWPSTLGLFASTSSNVHSKSINYWKVPFFTNVFVFHNNVTPESPNYRHFWIFLYVNDWRCKAFRLWQTFVKRILRPFCQQRRSRAVQLNATGDEHAESGNSGVV